MSLTSLRGYAGLASTALDTARSTFKAMADAAVQPDGTPTAPREAVTVAEAAPAAEPKPAARKGVRLGTVLDAYA